MSRQQLDRKYYYQRFDWVRPKPVKHDGKPDSLIFMERIKLKADFQKKFLEEHTLLLFDFETHILSNIHWYEKKIIKERTLRLAYILISLSLLLLVPILVALIQRYSDSVGAEITAIFTGFFALYQGVSKMLESRNVIATYWQTNSNLKSRLYSLEDKWKYRALDKEEKDEEKLMIELRDDLRDAVRFGIESVKTEKQLFFDAYSFPKFNILGSILGTRAQVGELFKRDDSDPTTTYRQREDVPPNPNLRLAQLTEKADQPLTDRTSTKKEKDTEKTENTENTEKNSGGGSNAQAGSISLKIETINTLLHTGESVALPFISRKAWGATPPKGGNLHLGKVSSFVVHHAAGYEDNGTNGAAKIRQIQRLHQDDRGWNDIGYHFIIDSVGKIYQGRSFMDPRLKLSDQPRLSRGAHVFEKNLGRIGICLLGNFQPNSGTKQHPTEDALQSLHGLIAFLKDAYNPTGDPHTNPAVAGKLIGGHRDYKSTSCPGDILYKIVEEMREAIPVA